MQIKIAELEGHVLDWFVAMCEGETLWQWKQYIKYNQNKDDDQKSMCYAYSTYWNVAGPIIRREIDNIFKWKTPEGEMLWCAVSYITHEEGKIAISMDGETEMIAAMRCYVANIMYPLDVVEVPDSIRYCEFED